jgi:hypothetical protein
MKTLSLLALACFCVHASAANAQSNEAQLRVNSRARITAPGIIPRPLVGQVLARDSVALILRPGRTAGDVSIPISAIERLEISRGHHRGRWAAAGLGMGLAAGFMAGAVVAFAGEGSAGDASFAPVGGAFLGMLVGPVIGAVAAPERWHPVAVRP